MLLSARSRSWLLLIPTVLVLHVFLVGTHGALLRSAPLLSSGHAPQLSPTREPLTAVSQLRELVFVHKSSMLTAHCDGGSAWHHKHFYPRRVICMKTNDAATLDGATWTCSPRGPHSVLTKIAAPRISCKVSQQREPDDVLWPLGVELINTASCRLRYKLDFRSASLAALSIMAFVVVFSMFALTAHTLLSFSMKSSANTRFRHGSSAPGSVETFPTSLKHTPSSALLSTSYNFYGIVRGDSFDSLCYTGDNDKQGNDHEVPSEDVLLSGYGTYARLLQRNLSEPSLSFSSDPPSPPATPPARALPPPNMQELRQAELLTELF